ncbi:MAG TPA: hypothetical protein VGV35_17740 [Bryobacteraceae bacterium]|nr:hypothetical protein [Bryobacteraceae bacterium]
MVNVWFLKRDTVSINDLVQGANPIAWDSDDALYKRLTAVHRVVEDHQLSTRWARSWENLYHDAVANQESVLH